MIVKVYIFIKFHMIFSFNGGKTFILFFEERGDEEYYTTNQNKTFHISSQGTNSVSFHFIMSFF